MNVNATTPETVEMIFEDAGGRKKVWKPRAGVPALAPFGLGYTDVTITAVDGPKVTVITENGKTVKRNAANLRPSSYWLWLPDHPGLGGLGTSRF